MGEGRGAPSLVRTLLAYADRGWDVAFVSGAGDQTEHMPPGHPNLRVASFSAGWLNAMMKLPRIGFAGRALWWVWFQLAAFSRAMRLARSGAFDLVYGYETLGVPVGRLLANLWRVPLVTRFQGTNLLVCWARKPLWRLRAWEHVVALRTRADLIIMTNDGTGGDEALALLGNDMTRVRFWMNGVDRAALRAVPAAREARAELSLPDGPILLAVSRLDTWKRLDRAVRAMPGVLAGFPTALLLIVGDGDERVRLEALAQTLGISANVRFEGAVPHSRVPLYLAASDIFLSLYDWSNVGNPLLEAMTAGKCVITLDNGTTANLIRHLGNGILLSPTDGVSAEVAGWITRLLTNPDQAQRLADEARAYADTAIWTWDERTAAEIDEVTRLLQDDRAEGKLWASRPKRSG